MAKTMKENFEKPLFVDVIFDHEYEEEIYRPTPIGCGTEESLFETTSRPLADHVVKCLNAFIANKADKP